LANNWILDNNNSIITIQYKQFEKGILLMKDARIIKLAENIINYSVEIKKGEKILIETFGDSFELTRELVRQTYKAGGIPYLTNKNNELIEYCWKVAMKSK
jgi:aminopeptidase